MTGKPQGIILMGMKHSGKSSLGRKLANDIALPFMDLDDLIIEEALLSPHFERSRRLTCREIFRFSPELFSELEYRGAQRAARELNKDSLILALGGGTIENRRAMELLSRNSILVYLEEAEKVLLSRILLRGIPPFLDTNNPGGSFKTLYEKRTKLYEEAADIILPLMEAPLHRALEMLKQKL